MDNGVGKLNIKRIVLVGFVIIGLFFGSLILWSFLAPLETGAVMSGKIRVESYRKSIQHLEGGIVKAVYVKDGSVVKVGETLVLLEDVQAKSAYEQQQKNTFYLKARLAELIAERDNADKITFPKELANSTDPEVKAVMEGEIAIFNARQGLLKKTLVILQEKINQIKNEISSLQAQSESANRQLELINEETIAVASLEKRRLIERPRLLALERAQAKLTGDRDENIALIARSEQKIGEVELEIIKTKQEKIKEVVESMQQVKSDLNSSEEKLSIVEDAYNRTIIKAPIAGIVVGLKVHTIGGVISPGETLMEIVPTQDKLIIDAKVNPIDINTVRPGLPAKVLFFSFPRRSTPTLDGIITKISADAYTDEKTGATYFTAEVIVSGEELKRLGHETIYPGMPVEVLAVTDQRTPLGYFVQPIRNSFFKAFRER